MDEMPEEHIIIEHERLNNQSFFTKYSTDSGTHAPCPETLKQCFPDLEIQVDACFPINPYATQLFCDFVQRELMGNDKFASMMRSYPPQNHKIAEFVSERINVEADRIFIGNGATEIIQAVLSQYVGKKVLVNLPTFSSYYEFLPQGAELVTYCLDKDQDFQVDIDHYLKFIETKKVDTAVIINPNNPDGNFLEPMQVKSILESLVHLKTVIVDESFIDFACPPDQDPLVSSITSYCDQFENLIVVKSMSKDMGIAGVRAGYALMQPEQITRLLKTGFLWNISALATYFFQLYARDDYYKKYRKVRKKYIKETHDFFNQLTNLPDSVKFYPSNVNFILMEILDGRTSAEITENLLFAHGIYVRDCSDKWGLDGEFLRIAAGTRKENKLVLEALEETLMG